jgi:hypothetical protein
MKKKIIICFILVLLPILSYSQDLTKDKAFFDKQILLYKEWLNQTNIEKAITFKNLEVTSNKVILNLNITEENYWHALKQSYDKNDNTSISELLFYRLIHILELSKGQALISMSDNKRYYVNIEFINNELTIREPKPKGPIEGKVSLPLIELNQKYIINSKDNINNNIDYVRKYLVKYLDSLYSTKYARSSSNPAIYKPIDTYGNSIDLTIKNITGEIMNDQLIGYYEYITIFIKIEQVNDCVIVIYTIQGKFGSGVFVAPRENDYEDMEKDYKNYLNNYCRNLKTNIRNYLLKIK